MSKFPRIYAESTLTRMHKKLELSDETVQLLYDYFDAFSNFYQRLPLKDAYDIFEKQNKGLVTKEKFIAFSEIARHEEHFYGILGLEELYLDEPKSEPFDREIVHESLLCFDFDEYYRMAEAQQKKPLYIPEKSKLLKYADDFYYEETPYTNALYNFFRKKLKYDAVKSEELVSECVFIILTGPKFMELLSNELERMNVKMSQAQYEEFFGIIGELNNNTSIPENRGFTPNELHTMMQGPGMPQKIVFGENLKGNLANGNANKEAFIHGIMNSDLPEELKLQMLSDISKIKPDSVKAAKVGRNDPCPCGSGKKHKKCCGK